MRCCSACTAGAIERALRAVARRVSRWCALLACVLATAASYALADTWLDAGDRGLRDDLTALADAGVIALPLNAWPIPTALVREALSEVAPEQAASLRQRPDLQFALDRLRAVVDRSSGLEFSAAAGQPARLRGFDELTREDSEWQAAYSVERERVSARLSVTAVVGALDGQSLRLDGSHLSVRAGNWLLSANLLDRDWGPGQDSSLILSSNARPIPALVIERATARAFEARWLSWLGPWRASALLGRMESERNDVDRPLFLGLRASFQPRPWIEIGAQRTAQFCGEGRPCSLSTFKDLLLGNDNRGIDATEASEPGNQLAGLDLRIVSPFVSLPVAIYTQQIGEDESGYWPVKLLGQFGVESWYALQSGALIRGYAEYADTACSYNRAQPRFGCAYTQGIFNAEGYRYRGRGIGHATDSDSESLAMGVSLREAAGDLWQLRLRSARLNRGAVTNPYNSVSVLPADYQSLLLGWGGERRWGRLQLQLGAQRYEPRGAPTQTQALGAVRWERDR